MVQVGDLPALRREWMIGGAFSRRDAVSWGARPRRLWGPARARDGLSAWLTGAHEARLVGEDLCLASRTAVLA